MRKKFFALAMFLASASLAQADMPPPQPCPAGTACWNASPPAQACVLNGDRVVCGEYVGSEPAPDSLHCAAGGDGCYLDANPGRVTPLPDDYAGGN